MRQLLGTDANGHVVATCRNPEVSTGLIELKKKFADRLSILPLDVTNESTIEVSLVVFPFLFNHRIIKIKISKYARRASITNLLLLEKFFLGQLTLLASLEVIYFIVY